MSPRRVALVGASEDANFTKRFVQSNTAYGRLDDGQILFVNPNRTTVLGNPCFPSIAALPSPVDTVVVAVPSARVEQVVEEGISNGVRAFVVHSSGFAEAGAVGVQRQETLRAMCAEAGAILVGPNCMGFLNRRDRWSLYGGHVPAGLSTGPVAVLSQSGSAGITLLNAWNRFGIDMLVSTGNEAVTTLEDLVDAALVRPEVKVVACFIEQLRRPDAFAQAAHKALRLGKPLVVMKVGQSPRGAQVSESHTGALAGEAHFYSALFDAFGVIEVLDFDEMIETLALFSSPQPRPKHPGVAAIGVSGGELAHIGDMASLVGAEFSDLRVETTDQMRALLGLPQGSNVVNPVDMGAGTPFSGSFDLNDRIRDTIGVLSADDGVGTVAVCQNLSSTFEQEQVATYAPFVDSAASAITETGVPGVIFSCPSLGFEPQLKQIADHYGVPCLQGSRASMKAVRRFGEYETARSAQLKEIAMQVQDRQDPIPLPRDLSTKLRMGVRLLEHDAKRLVQAAGIQVPRESLARSADEACAHAKSIGFPVVLKISSEEFTHKSDIGGVVLGITDEDMVRNAYEDIVKRATAANPDAHIDGILVAEQLTGGLELIVGAKYVDGFGATVLVGCGGTLVELLDDVVTGLLPYSRESALRLVRELKLAPQLWGYRGEAGYDVHGVADAMLAIGRLVNDQDGHVRELEVNPLLVRGEGQGAVALDARVITGRPPED